jgi:formamidopyrimidine-DNA glycosylase
MPELPDITVYVEALRRRVADSTLETIRITNPFLLRTTKPPSEEFADRNVVGVRRLGKRIVVEVAGELYAVIHLMIAGRLKWRQRGADPPRRGGLAAFDFSAGTLILTETGSKRRASLHLVAGSNDLVDHDPGGLEVLEADVGAFRERMVRENHTLKRALTDPRVLSGIGNAYSDEILHRARLSPFKQSARLTDHEAERLHESTVAVLSQWTDRLRAEVGDGFPDRVTAFREGMAVHGRFGAPCPDCGAPVQRIVYAESESNYCARCQTGGRLLADRSLSRLLKADWPTTIDELEQRRDGRE